MSWGSRWFASDGSADFHELGLSLVSPDKSLGVPILMITFLTVVTIDIIVVIVSIVIMSYRF